MSFPGTNFTMDELFRIHQSLKNWHFFLETLAKDVINDHNKKDNKDKINLPSQNKSSSALERLFNLILEKNTKLMSQIFILLFKAKNHKDNFITLTLEDIKKLENNLVSPKEIYLNVLNYDTENKLEKT